MSESQSNNIVFDITTKELIEALYSSLENSIDESEILLAAKVLLSIPSEKQKAIETLENMVQTKIGKPKIYAIQILMKESKTQEKNNKKDIGIIL